MTDAWAYMQAEMAKKPRPNPNVRVLGGTPLEGISDIPMSPADPGWKSKIPPPADPGPQQAAAAASVPVRQSQQVASGESRVTIYFTRTGYQLALERAPDWDIDGRMFPVSEEGLREFLPILAKIIKIKDTTGEFYVTHEEEQPSDERGVSSDRPSDPKPRKVRTQARKAKRDATARTGDAADSTGGDPSGPGLEAGDEALPGSGVQSDSEGEDTGMVGRFVMFGDNPLYRDPKLRAEFERKAKAAAYKKQVELRRKYRLDDDAEDARLGATGDSGG